MADQTSDETIRQMLAGFTTMQAQLGLLPMRQSQAMGMASTPFQPPPPPPMIHPADAALSAMQRHNDMVQQTLQAAQVTRYQPPPSAPTPAISAMVGMGVSNPFSAPFLGGGGGFGGGGARGGGGFAPAGTPHMPSVFNPFAPTLPASHFASPAMRNIQMMQHAQSQSMGMAQGIGEVGMGIGGSALGGAVGSMFGPLGTIAGSYLGSKIGGGIANMMFNPAVQDIARGRQMQNMTAPYMATGSALNPLTGQGLSREAGLQTATGIRHLQRDHDFERTGFNTQDAMRIMSLSAGQGLLSGAQQPDQIVQKVKDISKTVKVLMRITGDPDVRDAIASLGQMRELGFNGLAAQAGAVANRATFARQAGMSQMQMTQTMMGGAAMAGQFGLVGATGAMAGGYGAVAGHIAQSSGALNDLQLARAGGAGGFGQIMTQASLSALNNEQYLLAGSKVGRDGKVTADAEGYRRAQGMSFGDVQRMAAEKLQQMQAHGIFDWNTRKQEVKDQLAQSMSPGEMQVSMLNQARAFQKAVPGMTLGSAIEATTGLGADQARSIEAAVGKRGYWKGLQQQNRAQMREARMQDLSEGEQFHTPGVISRAGRGIRNTIGGIGDAVASPFAWLSREHARAQEENDAAEHGERIVRYSPMAINMRDGERAAARTFMASDSFNSSLRAPRLGNLQDPGSFARMANQANFTGLDSLSQVNRLSNAMSGAYGDPQGFQTFMGSRRSLTELNREAASVRVAANAMRDSGSFSTKSESALYSKLSVNGHSGAGVMQEITSLIQRDVKGAHANILGASGIGGDTIRDRAVQVLKSKGLSDADAKAKAAEMLPDIATAAYQQIKLTGSAKDQEVWAKTMEADIKAGGVEHLSANQQLQANIDTARKDLGLDRGGLASEKGASLFGRNIGGYNASSGALQNAREGIADYRDKNGEISGYNKKVLAMAASLSAASNEGSVEARAQGAKNLQDMVKGMSPDEAAKLTSDARIALGKFSKGSGGGQQLLRQLVTAKTSSEDLIKGIGGLGDVVSAYQARDMEKAAGEALQTAGGTGSSVVESLTGMTEAQINKAKNLTDDQKAAMIAAKRNPSDKKAMAKALSMFDPSAAEERAGSAGGAHMAALAKTQSMLTDAEDKFSEGDQSPADTADLNAKATDTFADAVQTFADAVKDLKGHGESSVLAGASPWMQALMHPGGS